MICILFSAWKNFECQAEPMAELTASISLAVSWPCSIADAHFA